MHESSEHIAEQADSYLVALRHEQTFWILLRLTVDMEHILSNKIPDDYILWDL